MKIVVRIVVFIVLIGFVLGMFIVVMVEMEIIEKFVVVS